MIGIIEDEDITYMTELNGYNFTLTKQEALPIIQKLIDFYISTDDEEIIWNNEIKKERIEASIESTKSKKPKDRNVNGFVYVFECENTYKIGFSRNVNRRFKEIATMQSKPMRILLEKYFDNAYRVEQYYHNNLQEFNTQGEWYRFTKNQITELLQELNSLDKEYLRYETINK